MITKLGIKKMQEAVDEVTKNSKIKYECREIEYCYICGSKRD